MTSSSFKSVVFLFALLGGLAVILQGCGGDDDDDKDSKTPDKPPAREDIVNTCAKDCKITTKCSGDERVTTYENCPNKKEEEKDVDKECKDFDELASSKDLEKTKKDACEEAGAAEDSDDGNLLHRPVACTECTVTFTCDKKGPPPGQVTVTADGAKCVTPLPDAPEADADPEPCQKFDEKSTDVESSPEKKQAYQKEICDEYVAEETPADPKPGEEAKEVLSREITCDSPSTCVITIQCDPNGAKGNAKTIYKGCTTKEEEETDDDDECKDYTTTNNQNNESEEKKTAEKKEKCDAADAPEPPAEGGGDGGSGDGGDSGASGGEAGGNGATMV